MNKENLFAHYRSCRQQGVATVLVVTLVGISVMLATASVALSVSNKREANTTNHAQANVQTLNWAGVSAFQQHLQETINQLTEGENLAEKIRQIGELTLSETPQKIVAKIKDSDDSDDVVGCATLEEECRIAAEITAYSDYSKASSSIQVIFHLRKTQNNTEPNTDEDDYEVSFGKLEVSGIGTTLATVTPNSTVNIQSDGDLALRYGFKTENISVLNIESEGNVRINCGHQNCGNARININSLGNVTVIEGNNFGDINAHGVVKLQKAAHAQNIASLKHVSINHDDTSLYDGIGSPLFLKTSSAKNIEALGKVAIYQGQINGDIKANGEVTVRNSTVNGNIITESNITLSRLTIFHSRTEVNGSLYARGINNPKGTLVSNEASYINGDIYANGDISLRSSSKVNNVTINGKINNGSRTVKGTAKTELKDIVVSTDMSGLTLNEDNIFGQKQTKTYVDVTKYKDEANYIFTKSGKFDRVYLNKVIHPTTGHTYTYKDGIQHEHDNQGNEVKTNQNGFYLGSFDVGDKKYTGAICAAINSGMCTSDVIGYLPRIGVSSVLGIDDDYGFGVLTTTWRLRSLRNHSSVESAVLAPGIMYFEGNLEFAGAANWRADSHSNAFINTFLAEGRITSIAFSPRIFSPFKVLLEGNDKEHLVCDRVLTDIDGNQVHNTNSLNPIPLSNKYLRPTNLCASNEDGVQKFKPGMSLGPNGDKLIIKIDDQEVEKVELGQVALMANKRIHIGACTQIYGDVMSRVGVTVSKACGITKNKNVIQGGIYVGSAKPKTTWLLAGSKLVLDNGIDLTDADKGTNAPDLYQFDLEWAKSL